jgi:hypothetical protein
MPAPDRPAAGKQQTECHDARGQRHVASRKEDLLSAIHDLIAQVSDPRLRERLAAEWASASKEKKFGLVFEDHLPELLPLHKAKPRRGDLVAYSTPSRTPFRSDGGQHSTVMADTVPR